MHLGCTHRATFNELFLYKYKPFMIRRKPLKFKRFGNKSYSLFGVLGREVLVGTLSVSTLAHAKAAGISTQPDKVGADSAVVASTREL